MATDWKEVQMRLEEARNKGTSPERLLELAADKDHMVRNAVAENPNTPPEALAHLASDEDYVRLAVAKHPGTPRDFLAVLVEDGDPEVRRAALRHFKQTRT
ncbi:MAG: hypothetical protein LBF50_10920 [Azoarcus sp.]|jgi:hypothetical protein|nr:hypothetical protein [Azoarcus sp.]